MFFPKRDLKAWTQGDDHAFEDGTKVDFLSGGELWAFDFDDGHGFG